MIDNQIIKLVVIGVIFLSDRVERVPESRQKKSVQKWRKRV